jgi:hypothetical protein
MFKFIFHAYYIGTQQVLINLSLIKIELRVPVLNSLRPSAKKALIEYFKRWKDENNNIYMY